MQLLAVSESDARTKDNFVVAFTFGVMTVGHRHLHEVGGVHLGTYESCYRILLTLFTSCRSLVGKYSPTLVDTICKSIYIVRLKDTAP